MKTKRTSGILLHITSLPGRYGIGDFGSEAYSFVNFLRESNQKIWQILPLTFTENCSPYSAASAFAGNPLLISLDELLQMNLLTNDDLNLLSSFNFDDDYVKFKQVTIFKNEMLKKAFQNYQEKPNEHLRDLIEEFRQRQYFWLDDYSLYMTIKEKQNIPLWAQWPYELKHRDKQALDRVREQDKSTIEYYIFVQFLFYYQWSQLKVYANNSGIQIIGDMPVYCDYYSVDVWASTHIFQLDQQTLLPTAVSGFPPDDCSEEGQNWNMPIYDWNNPLAKPHVFQWWINRLKNALTIYDFVRIDHFRGLQSYWSIPVDENFVPLKPIAGTWMEAPGSELFSAVQNEIGSDLPIIVEDLGEMTEEIFQLRDQFNLTGIRILQFGFGFYPDNIYRLHNYIPNSVAYTGTHDNPPVLGWWRELASVEEKRNFIEYIKRPEIYDGYENEQEHINWMINHLNDHIHWYLIQMVLASVSNIAIIQFQDFLGLDNSSRMNNPALASNPDDDNRQNWSWRFRWEMIDEKSKMKLKLLTHLYYRDDSPKNEFSRSY